MSGVNGRLTRKQVHLHHSYRVPERADEPRHILRKRTDTHRYTQTHTHTLYFDRYSRGPSYRNLFRCARQNSLSLSRKTRRRSEVVSRALRRRLFFALASILWCCRGKIYRPFCALVACVFPPRHRYKYTTLLLLQMLLTFVSVVPARSGSGFGCSKLLCRLLIYVSLKGLNFPQLIQTLSLFVYFERTWVMKLLS